MRPNAYEAESEKVDWDDFHKWLLANKSRLHANTMFKRAKEHYRLAFSQKLVFWESTRKRQDILKCLALFTRYLDLKQDTEFHYELLKWMKKKDLKWNSVRKQNTYQLAKIIPIESILNRINQLPKKIQNFWIIQAKNQFIDT